MTTRNYCYKIWIIEEIECNTTVFVKILKIYIITLIKNVSFTLQEQKQDIKYISETFGFFRNSHKNKIIPLVPVKSPDAKKTVFPVLPKSTTSGTVNCAVLFFSWLPGPSWNRIQFLILFVLVVELPVVGMSQSLKCNQIQIKVTAWIFYFITFISGDI